jgi:hypothetical protein
MLFSSLKKYGSPSCKEATVLDNLQSLLRAHDTSPNLSTSHDNEIPDDVPESFQVARQVWKDTGASVHAGDMEVFSAVKLL